MSTVNAQLGISFEVDGSLDEKTKSKIRLQIEIAVENFKEDLEDILEKVCQLEEHSMSVEVEDIMF